MILFTKILFMFYTKQFWLRVSWISKITEKVNLTSAKVAYFWLSTIFPIELKYFLRCLIFPFSFEAFAWPFSFDLLFWGHLESKLKIKMLIIIIREILTANSTKNGYWKSLREVLGFNHLFLHLFGTKSLVLKCIHENL